MPPARRRGHRPATTTATAYTDFDLDRPRRPRRRQAAEEADQPASPPAPLDLAAVHRLADRLRGIAPDADLDLLYLDF